MSKKYRVLKQFQKVKSSDPEGAKRDIWVAKSNPNDPIDEYNTLKKAKDKEKKLKDKDPDRKFKIVEID